MNFTVKIKINETDIDFQTNDYYLSFAILLITVSVFGIIGNIISFLVLRRIEKRCSSYTYLTGKLVLYIITFSSNDNKRKLLFFALHLKTVFLINVIVNVRLI